MIPLHVVSTVVQRGNNSTLTEAPMFKKNKQTRSTHIDACNFRQKHHYFTTVSTAGIDARRLNRASTIVHPAAAPSFVG